MRHSLLRHALPLALLCCSINAASAQIFDEDYTGKDTSGVNADISLRSARVFRGQNIYDGTSIEPAIKGDLDTQYGTLHAGVFTHFSAGGRAKQAGAAPYDSNGQKVQATTPGFEEYDFNLAYRNRYDLAKFEAGNNWYTYSESTPRLKDTSELYGQVTLDTFLQPRLMAAYDYDKRDGWYYETGIEEPFAVQVLHDSATVTPSVTLGLNSGLDHGSRAIYDSSGAVAIDWAVTGKLPLNDTLNLQPELHFNQAIDDNATDDFWFGMSVGGKLNF